MADNTVLNSGSGGDTIASDDIAGIKHQRVKIQYGDDGSATDVSDTNPLPIDDAGGSITVDGTVTANLSATDNAVLDTIETNTDYGAVVGGGVEATALRVTLANDSTGVVSIDDNGGSVTVDGTITEANSTAILADTASMDTNIGTIAGDTTSLDGKVVVGGGTEAGAVRVTLANNSTGVISIDDGGNTITVDGTVTANAGSGTMTVDLGANNDVQGQAAHDAAVSGNPVVVGARASNSIEGITQVANGDATRLAADLNGVTVTRPHTTLEESISERISNTNGTSTAFTNFAAGGAGIHNYVTTISIYNSSATDGYVDFRDGAAGSIIFTAAAPAAGGSVINLPVPLKGAANTALAYDVSGALSTVYISVIGFQAQG